MEEEVVVVGNREMEELTEEGIEGMEVGLLRPLETMLSSHRWASRVTSLVHQLLYLSPLFVFFCFVLNFIIFDTLLSEDLFC